jgi:hypothetical protein
MVVDTDLCLVFKKSVFLAFTSSWDKAPTQARTGGEIGSGICIVTAGWSLAILLDQLCVFESSIDNKQDVGRILVPDSMVKLIASAQHPIN